MIELFILLIYINHFNVNRFDIFHESNVVLNLIEFIKIKLAINDEEITNADTKGK
jgi:hypothetical protein